MNLKMIIIKWYLPDSLECTSNSYKYSSLDRYLHDTCTISNALIQTKYFTLKYPIT